VRVLARHADSCAARLPGLQARVADSARVEHPSLGELIIWGTWPASAPAPARAWHAARAHRVAHGRVSRGRGRCVAQGSGSSSMPSAPWTAAGEGRDRRSDGLGGGWPGAYRRGAPHSQRDRASSPVSFAREARLTPRTAHSACSCGHGRRSARPASRRRLRGTDSVDRPCPTWRDRARARSRALLARSSLNEVVQCMLVVN
jgi:hypothetical protein